MSVVAPPVPCRDRTHPLADVRAGVLAMAPMVVAYVPFALVVGTVLAQHGDVVFGVVGTWAVFAGSAHVASLRALDRAGILVAVLTGMVVNARLIVYSAGLARRWRDQPVWFRLAAAPLVIDPTWALADQFAVACDDPTRQRRHFLAAGLTLGVGFSAAVAVGMLVGNRLGLDELEVAVPLCLLALVGPALRRRSSRRVAVVSAAVALATMGWPSGTGLLVAVTAGCLAGLTASEATSDATSGAEDQP